MTLQGHDLAITFRVAALAHSTGVMCRPVVTPPSRTMSSSTMPTPSPEELSGSAIEQLRGAVQEREASALVRTADRVAGQPQRRLAMLGTRHLPPDQAGEQETRSQVSQT
ncbi:MAG: hypothetical protein JWQ37_3767 [Blastococcus sp.]|nr:hypothetical protein [Blastococcus sp.]